ncbi:MAG: MBL fold metallo-hydrolase [Hyphomonadaceae bacterium]
MKLIRALLLIVVVLVALAAVGAFAFREQIGRALFERTVTRNLARDVMGGLPDGLHAVLCGSGSPMSDPTRMGPCTAVIAGDHLFVVDMGSGAARNFAPMGLPIGDAEAAFITHFHSDHIDGLGEFMLLRWVNGGHDAPLPVYGPEGVDAVVNGFNAAYTLDRGYRVAHHGADINPPAGFGGTPHPFAFPEGRSAAVVYDQDGVRVTAISVSHPPISPSVAYRFDYSGRSLVISGDTTPSPALVENARGADLLIHEALNAEMVSFLSAELARQGDRRAAKIVHDILDYHTTPLQAAETAQQAGVRALLLTHIVPPVPVRYLEAYYMRGTAGVFDGQVILGRDGGLVSLPRGGERVETRMLSVR